MLLLVTDQRVTNLGKSIIFAPNEKVSWKQPTRSPAAQRHKQEIEPWSTKQLCSLLCQQPPGWMAAAIPGGLQGQQGGQEPVTRSPRSGDVSMGCAETEQMRYLDVFHSHFCPVGNQTHEHRHFATGNISPEIE